MRGDVLYAHAGRSLSLYFSSLTTTIHLFSSLILYTLVHPAYTYTRLVDNDGQRQDFPLLFSSYVKRKTREEKKEKKKRIRTLMNNLLLFLDWSNVP